MNLKKFFKNLGPGLITGASDDDPAGIAIYSQAGSRTGYSLLWIAPFVTPFMIAIQEMCARIGMVTGQGIVGVMRQRFPMFIVWLVAAFVLAANSVNIGADLLAMAGSTKLLLPVNTQVVSILYAAIIVLALIFFSYSDIAKILKVLTLALFAYIFATFASSPDWFEIIKHTVIPRISFDGESLTLIVAILGTTISPYLFFWQAGEQAEEKMIKKDEQPKKRFQIVSRGALKAMEEDVSVGMVFSNIVMFFIISTVASTLYRGGINDIQTVEQAAGALRPFAGDASFLLFTLGVLGTGFLAIPVLAGSAAYAVSEAIGVPEGFRLSFSQSKVFYGVIIISTVIGLSFSLFNIEPFKALFATGIIYGFLAPILILIILKLANNKEIMGERINGIRSNVFGIAAVVMMALAALGTLILIVPSD